MPGHSRAMSFDISGVLEGWEYEPGQILVRKFKTKAGAEKIQLRVDLGVLQMNVFGRPDGKRPFGHDSFLDHCQARLNRYKEEHGDDSGYCLGAEECTKLQQEAIQYHHRYICFFQLQDYEGVLRDTERNLRAYQFVRRYAPAAEGTGPLHPLIPQLFLLQTRAKAMAAIDESKHAEAIGAVEDGLLSLKEFYEHEGRAEAFDESAEAESLENFLGELQEARPMSEKERLERELTDAIRREEYERAANLRDQLRHLGASEES